jgi:hypothetical protein
MKNLWLVVASLFIFNLSIAQDNKSDIAMILNAALSDPVTREALVRELIASGWCSPSVWALADMEIPEIFSLHEDEAEARMAAVHVTNAIVVHWKGQSI